MNQVPPLWTCTVCGLRLRPEDSSCERKAIVWLKAKGTSITRVVEELYEYKHVYCSDKDIVIDQPALF